MSNKKVRLTPFEMAFSRARHMGETHFMFRGKKYHTLTKEEVEGLVQKHFAAISASKNQEPPEPITLEAHRIVYGRGEQEYGHPRKNFQHTADLWNAQFQNILGEGPANKFTAEDVAYALILVKLSRQENFPKRDNMVDIAGYAETAQRVIDKPIL